jgi:flagellar basal-body rod modification protein FlgD
VIDGIGQTTSAATTGSNSSNKDKAAAEVAARETALGRDAFLNLLVTQLRHQDPLQPQADGEFIAQLAQFSSLEQLTQIQQTLEAMKTAMGVTTPTT